MGLEMANYKYGLYGLKWTGWMNNSRLIYIATKNMEAEIVGHGGANINVIKSIGVYFHYNPAKLSRILNSLFHN